MPECGTQCWLCDLPIRFDTYEGCSHACSYCFAKRNREIDKINSHESASSLAKFVRGERVMDTKWADWKIPLHWGGMSDPFQPAEKKYRFSYECLKVFAESKYPFVVSTKGRLIAEDEYLDLLSQCNCVVQVSAVCSKYDKLELGAPTFEERLEIVRKISPRVKRVVIRVQPYMHEVLSDVLKNISRFADAGVYGMVFEGMKFLKKKQGLIKIGGDYCYPAETLKKDFEKLRNECHRNGLKFYSGENRLRKMGDSLTCCGVDGLEGFIPNTYNINHMVNGGLTEPTEAQKQPKSGNCFSRLNQKAGYFQAHKNDSFVDSINYMLGNKKTFIEETLTAKR